MTGYIGFGNDRLTKLPKVKEGDLITCSKCGHPHKLLSGTDDKGQKDDLILFYECGNELYLGAIGGRCVAGVKPDCSGKI